MKIYTVFSIFLQPYENPEKIIYFVKKKSHGHSFVPNGVKLHQNGLLLMQFHLMSYESISGKNVSATFFLTDSEFLQIWK